MKSIIAALMLFVSVSVSAQDAQSMMDVVKNSEDHTTLMVALEKADLFTKLQNANGLTILAPTNAAFNQLPAATLEELLKPENKKKLQSILTYHVFGGVRDVAALKEGIHDLYKVNRFETYHGHDIEASMNAGNLVFADDNGNQAKVVGEPITTADGIVYVIDAVLMPRDVK